MTTAAMPSPTLSGENLLHNLVLFGRLLRYLGLDVNPGRMLDLTAALALVDIGRKSDFYHTLRALLVHRRDEVPLFDQAFELFWYALQKGEALWEMADFLQQQRGPEMVVLPPPLTPDVPAGDEEGDEAAEVLQVLEVTRTYSDREALRQKDFAAMTAAELQAVRLYMAQLVWELGRRRTRRFRPGGGVRLDVRRVIRHNLRYGGEVLEWPRLAPKYKPRPLVIIADISGSMERYTRLLLQFVYSLAEGLNQSVEAFVFSTRLTRVTRQLRGRDVDRALADVAAAVPDWSGGTRIGAAMETFNFKWGRRVLGRGAVALIISDGWDRGDPLLLGAEMARLQRSCYRVIWLNPLLGSPRYEPLTRGLQAALPYVDDFLPVHNLASLADLAEHLRRLDERRRLRRQLVGVNKTAFIGR